MESESTIVKLDSIDSYNKLYGLETRHPLVTVINLSEATKAVNHVRMDYGIYALFLKNGASCTLKYGRNAYDYQEGTIVSFSPGQLISVDSDTDELAPDVIGLLFHPDLLFGTPLATKITKYSFFDYSQREALHLSLDERKLFLDMLGRIQKELDYPVDRYSADIVASHIQLLLDYLMRFYERQFITRRKTNSVILDIFEKSLKAYYIEGHGKDGIPTVNYFAGIANLTPGYFGDMVKKETGKSAQEIISRHVIETAKQRLHNTSEDISIIAYYLGFQHPQHFSRMFKRITGLSPTKFRDKFQSEDNA